MILSILSAFATPALYVQRDELVMPADARVRAQGLQQAADGALRAVFVAEDAEHRVVVTERADHWERTGARGLLPDGADDAVPFGRAAYAAVGRGGTVEILAPEGRMRRTANGWTRLGGAGEVVQAWGHDGALWWATGAGLRGPLVLNMDPPVQIVVGHGAKRAPSAAWMDGEGLVVATAAGRTRLALEPSDQPDLTACTAEPGVPVEPCRYTVRGHQPDGHVFGWDGWTGVLVSTGESHIEQTCRPGRMHPCDPVGPVNNCPKGPPPPECSGTREGSGTQRIAWARDGAVAFGELPTGAVDGELRVGVGAPGGWVDARVVGEHLFALVAKADGTHVVQLGAEPASEPARPVRTAFPGGLDLSGPDAVGASGAWFREVKFTWQTPPVRFATDGVHMGGADGVGIWSFPVPTDAPPTRVVAEVEVGEQEGDCAFFRIAAVDAHDVLTLAPGPGKHRIEAHVNGSDVAVLLDGDVVERGTLGPPRPFVFRGVEIGWPAGRCGMGAKLAPVTLSKIAVEPLR
ncbi:MAG: hypothetical protein H6737_06330 [Alphaproteobacteria bacterium]|nr:hypothetical protein [Alphaproteobacteria bacterium]